MTRSCGEKLKCLLSCEESAAIGCRRRCSSGLDAVEVSSGGRDHLTLPHPGWARRRWHGLGVPGGGHQAGSPGGVKFLPEESARILQRSGASNAKLVRPRHWNIPTFARSTNSASMRAEPFLVMQLLEGQTLRELIAARRTRRSHPWKSRGYSILLVQMTDGLEAAHQQRNHPSRHQASKYFRHHSKAKRKFSDFGLAKLAPAGRSCGG